jgi:hypothetical protein
VLSARLFGRDFLLAVEGGEGEPGSPGEYESNLEVLRAKLGERVVLVLHAIPSYVRNRLVQLGVPFIVPGSQMFIPMVFIDLRERQARPKPPGAKSFTPAAQCVVLYHLQINSLTGRSMQEIAGTVGYSAIMMTKVKAELESAEISESVREGRATTLHFLHEGRRLWEHALPFCSSPIKKKHWVQWDTPAYPALMAGMSALSRRTMIEDDRLPTFALGHKTYLSNLETGFYRGSPGPDEANVCLEAWNYEPKILGDNELVDPLSLYLSLQDSPDERVQQQLEQLIEEMRW